VWYNTFSIWDDVRFHFVTLLLKTEHINDECYCGVCSRVLRDKDEVIKAALETATTIAAKSPVVVQGTKISLVYSRDHSVADSLQQVVCV